MNNSNASGMNPVLLNRNLPLFQALPNLQQSTNQNSQQQSSPIMGFSGLAQPASSPIKGFSGLVQPATSQMMGFSGLAQPESSSIKGFSGLAQPESSSIKGFSGLVQPASSKLIKANGLSENIQQQTQINRPKNQLNSELKFDKLNCELILLENFIFPIKIKILNSTIFKPYCNACCTEIPNEQLDKHLKSSKHFNNRKRLNNQLLTVNLFQLSKHYEKKLTESLNKSFTSYNNYNKFMAIKLLDYQEFEDFLTRNLTLKFKLTLYGSIPNQAAINKSDINVNIELLDEKDENTQDILKLIKALIQERGLNKFKLIKSTNLDRHERAYFKTKSNNLINLININKFKHSNLIGQYVNFDERVKILMFNIRLWANYCDLDQPLKGTYRATLIQIMVIYFLQHCNSPVLPNFHQILEKTQYIYDEKDNKQHPIEPISDRELNLISSSWKTNNTQTVGELWVDFFKYYLFFFDHETTYVNIVHQCKPKISKAFSVCNLIDGTVFSVIFNWRIHYERLNKLLFDMYKHSCFFPYPAVSNDDLDVYLQFIFSSQDFKRDQEFKLIKKKVSVEEKVKIQKVQFELKQLWRLSVKLNFKVCIKTELDPLKKQKFNIKINYQIPHPELPRYCVLCKSKNHFVKDCKNMDLPDLQPIENGQIEKSALLIDLISENYYKFKSVNENRDILKAINEVKFSLINSIQSIYPDARLELYGSILSGFGQIDSDLDLALLFQSPQVDDQINHKSIVRRIGNSSLRKMRNIEDLLIIVNCRVPILKFKYVTESRKFDCDISIENRLAFCNTYLLRIYCTIDPRVPRIGLLVKRFAKLCQICFANQGSLKSYAFNIMLIYFLQKCDPPVLPVLHELDQDNLQSEIISGWEIKFFQDLDRIQEVWPGYKKNTKSVGQLFIEFFIFYTELFNFDKDVITIRTSNRLTKFEKRWTSIIAIEDPFLLSHNLSDALEISMVNYIKTCFIMARNHFSSLATNKIDNNLRLADIFELIFNANVLKNSLLIPHGRGCQICFKIGHKKANCPDRTAMVEKERQENDLPIEFNITLNDLSTKNSQYLQLIEQMNQL